MTGLFPKRDIDFKKFTAIDFAIETAIEVERNWGHFKAF